jgi:hypothetical protein
LCLHGLILFSPGKIENAARRFGYHVFLILANDANNAAGHRVLLFFEFDSKESQSMLSQDSCVFEGPRHAGVCVITRAAELKVFCDAEPLCPKVPTSTHCSNAVRIRRIGTALRVRSSASPDSTGISLIMAFLFPTSPIAALSLVSHQPS